MAEVEVEVWVGGRGKKISEKHSRVSGKKPQEILKKEQRRKEMPIKVNTESTSSYCP